MKQPSLVRSVKKCIDTLLLLNVDVFIMYVSIAVIITTKFRLIPSRAYPILLANIFFITAAYTLNKVADHAEDFINEQTRVRLNKNGIYILSALFLVLGTFFYTTVGGLPFFGYGLLITMLSLWYSFPKHARLKNLLIIKNLTPSFCWFFSLCILFYAGGVHLNLPEVILGLSPLLILFFTFEIIWDMPDHAGDRLLGVKTLPVVIGFRYTRFVVCLLLAVVFLLVSSRLNKIMAFVLLLYILFVPETARKLSYHYFLVSLVAASIAVYLTLLTFFALPGYQRTSHTTATSSTAKAK